MPLPLRRFAFLLLAQGTLFCSVLPAQIADPSDQLGNPFAPFVIRLDDDSAMSPLPSWMSAPAQLVPDLGTIEVPLPSLRAQPHAERFVVTVVFEDGGDGGPSMEWREPDGEVVVLSEGLGEALDDQPLGLNARQLLLPDGLTREGGTLIVTYFDRFAALKSVTIEPATQSMVAVVGGTTDPAVVDERLIALTAEATSGRRVAPLSGDVRDGSVIEAELSASIEPLAEALEFVVPVEGRVEASLVVTEVLGLDPEATVEVFLNGEAAGVLAMEPFELDGPATSTDEAGRVIVAGWRKGSLYLPSRQWRNGENSVTLQIRRAADETGKPVFLKATGLRLRFATPEPAVEPPAAPAPEEPGLAPEIDFLELQPFIELPRARGMPVVITTKDE